jgi:carbon storage regulator CsrA
MQARTPRKTKGRRALESAKEVNARRRSMLVLTRKIGESICIGDDVEVRVIETRGHKVRLAIEAPQAVAVRRKELPLRPGDQLRLAHESLLQQRRRAVS